ncbi:unnamed protein product [Adineta ricciae]|uniref:Uncharacterized protein n=1 Tax=Adineta ricciae TaxID=249248 RepID=A0A815Y941_ADIRI|nr:unnamed protein product [Adineta ricciae]CAF1567756.1 unnamed protein product [Adineta ricciae]
MEVIYIFFAFLRLTCGTSPTYRIVSATAWVTDPISLYPDFSASLTPLTFQPSIFQYSFHGASTVFTCVARNCSRVTMTPMPGLSVAQLAYGGVSPRRIHQQSPTIAGARFFLSIGYAKPNRDVELIVCAAEDLDCAKPRVMNTVDSPGFGQGGLRLTFATAHGLPSMLIPEARYASRDNRVTGYHIETCQDPLCALPRTAASLPFNLTGTANCLATSIDVAINRRGFPSWLTLCDEELNLIHCLTLQCNETLVNQFKVNRDFVYFVYLAVDSHFRFTIVTTGQTAQSDITYIRCVDPDCTESIQSQLTISNRPSPTRTPIGQVQVVINPLTDLPIFHLTGSIYPTDVPVYMFVVCTNIECNMSEAVYVDYGAKFGLSRVQVNDLFVDDEGTVIASVRTTYKATNDTINAIVRMALSSEAEVEKLTFVEPVVI